MARLHRFRMAIAPVRLTVGEHVVTFVGLVFHSRALMLEYDVDPPLASTYGTFGQRLLTIVASDDLDEDRVYETCWEDFNWSFEAEGRLTTRLEGRPAASATVLHISVKAAPTREPLGPTSWRELPSEELLATFDIALPAGHGDLKPPRAPRSGFR